MSSNDKIEALLKKYADLAEEEHREHFYKPTTNHQGRPRFICQNCSKMKMCGKCSSVTFYRLDGSFLLFCNLKCFSQWLKRNPKVTWKFDPKRFGNKNWRKPIETGNAPLPVSENEKQKSEADKKDSA